MNSWDMDFSTGNITMNYAYESPMNRGLYYLAYWLLTGCFVLIFFNGLNDSGVGGLRRFVVAILTSHLEYDCIVCMHLKTSMTISEA